MFEHGPTFSVYPIDRAGRMTVHRVTVMNAKWDALRFYIRLPTGEYRYLTWWAPARERQFFHANFIVTHAADALLRKLERRKLKPALYRLGRPPQSFRR